jgi:hypothetical protein
MPEQQEDELRIAVIGDVGVDWGFISNEPSRPRAPFFQPWAHYPATHLFAFPGGAWFTGHMIQGAIAPAPFRHHYFAKVQKSVGADRATMIALTGKLACYAMQPSAVIITIELTKDAEGNTILDRVIINDDEETDASEVDSLTVTLKSEVLNSASITLGILDGQIEFESYTSKIPGSIEPDTVHRMLYLTNARLKGPDENITIVECNLLTVHAKFMALEIHKKDGTTVAPSRPTSLSLVSAPARRGEPRGPAVAEIKLPESHGAAIYLKEATIDVSYGSVEVLHRIVDEGKLNGPRISASPTAKNPVDVTMSCDRRPLAHSGGPSQYGLWMYDNPGLVVSMQHQGHLVQTLSELSRFPQSSLETRSPQVYRLKKRHGIDGPEHGYPTILNGHYKLPDLPSWHSSDTPRIVVIDDEGTGFCSRFDCWSPFLWNSEGCGAPPSGYPGGKAIFEEHQRKALRESLSRTWVVIKASHWLHPGHAGLMDFLERCDLTDRTILVISGDSLRGGLISSMERPGIKLAKTVSWERVIEDFQAALNPPKLGPLLICRNMVVRIGLEGAIHFHRVPPRPSDPDAAIVDERTEGLTTLFFDPQLIEGEYGASDKHGELPGLTSVFVAALVRELACHVCANRKKNVATSERLQDALKEGIVYGLQSARRFYDLGYGPSPETVRKYERLELPITQIFGRAPLAVGDKRGRHKFEVFRAHSIVETGEWSILNRQLDVPLNVSGTCIPEATHGAASFGPVCRATNALILGRTIVIRGAEYAFKQCPFSFPYAKFGELLTVDRREIEGLRSIRNVLAEYVGHPERKVPLSIAVFGPPGSGKSFGVRQITAMVAGSRRIRESLFNLAQFEDFSEVSRVLLQVRDAALDNELPLVFFDEFDSPLKNTPLGWLKYFLAPMHDGRFQHGESMLGIGKAIFAFAGGIAARHADFTNDAFWNKRSTSVTSGNIFTSAKGPDFHSRLRGFLNIVGPNPKHVGEGTQVPGADPYLAEDFAYVVRRALVVRQIIERIARESEAALLDVDGRADIDRDVLDALLLTEEYKHGVRSLHAIFEMSALHNERSISKTIIPAPHQIGMHVDATFGSILRREYNKLNSTILQMLYKAPTIDTFEAI